MYFQLFWKIEDGRVDSQKLSTTEEKAQKWARQKNLQYPDIKHWFKQVEYQQNTPQIGVMK